MDGDVLSDSNVGNESGSGTWGQESSNETLKALEELTQSVKELKGEIEENKSYLEQLTSKVNSLENISGSIKISEPIPLQNGENRIEVPEGARAALVNGGNYNHLISVKYGEKNMGGSSWGVNYGYWSPIILPSGVEKITVSSQRRRGNLFIFNIMIF